MTAGWLDPLRAVLDQAERPVAAFFRDDDAGWADERLMLVLDVFSRHNVPVDLAVIPKRLTRNLAARLLARAEGPVPVGFLQHGFAHLNHEAEGKKFEFGPSRSREQQRGDIAAGRRLLERRLGPAFTPVFAPPWNRCTNDTVSCLAELGFLALSRDAQAQPLVMDGLAELPVTVDWFKKRKGVALGRTEIGELLAASASCDRTVGVMLHHQLMDEEERAALEALVALVARHPAADCVSMRALLGVDPGSPGGGQGGTWP